MATEKARVVEALEELVEVIIQHDDGALELELAVLKLSVQNRDIVSSFGASKFVKKFGPNLLALNPPTDRTKVKILLKLDVPLEFCPQAGEKGGCPQKGCLRLHLCPFFIKNKCKFGVKCKRSHNFSDEQTFRVLNHLRLGFLLNDPSKHSLTKLLNQIVDESEIQRTAASRSVPDICKFYNKGVCTKGANCPCLHICEHFVDGDCKFGKNCKREHSLSDEHNTRVLQEYSIQCTPIVLLFLKGRERKRTVSEGSDVERPIRAKPISAMTDIKPALSQGLAVDSKEKDCEICGFNLRGKCHYGDRCLHRHTELPYLWEFSVNDDDKWESVSSDLNTMLEDAYCDVDSDGYKLRVRGLSCYVQFKDMTVVPKVGFHKVVKIRRLSTVSSVVAPVGHIFSTRWNWYWQDENQTWQSYDTPDDGHAVNTTSSQCLEKGYVEGKESHPFSAPHHQYTLYFKNMYQQNDACKTKRPVRRRPADLVTKENMKEIAQKRRAAVSGPLTVASAAASRSDGLPSHWIPMPDGTDYERVRLTSISEGYKKAEKKFLETMEGHHNIVSIEQVQNTDLWTLYTQRKSHLAKKSSKQPEERQLFHGTNASTVEAISQQGFDWRMCGKHGTRFGKGTYFACKANYSHCYTLQDSVGGHRMMFLARVLVGSFTNGSSEMIRPPAKDPSNPHVLYDSCCDNSSNPALFVVFENGQSYPEFLITYT